MSTAKAMASDKQASRSQSYLSQKENLAQAATKGKASTQAAKTPVVEKKMSRVEVRATHDVVHKIMMLQFPVFFPVLKPRISRIN
jgi:hypothetical protein